MEIILSTSMGLLRHVSLAESKEDKIIWKGDPMDAVQQWIEHYYTKKASPDFLPPLDETQFISPKTREVCMKLYEIPFGTTITYKEFAKKVGMEGAQRAVGTMIGKNPFALFLPCHRVIRSNGTLGGFFFGLSLKQTMLSFEKLIIT